MEEGEGVDKLREGEKRRQMLGGGNQHSIESLIQFSHHETRQCIPSQNMCQIDRDNGNESFINHKTV